MKHGKDTGASHSEERHRLSEAIDGLAPRLVQQEQNCRDQRPGMADTDPPDEIDDVESPSNRNVDTPDSDTPSQQVNQRKQQRHRSYETHTEQQEPLNRRLAVEHDSADLFRQRPVIVTGADDRRRVYGFGRFFTHGKTYGQGYLWFP